MPFPATVGQAIHGRTISPFSAFSIGSDIGLFGGPASTTWASAQTALYVPFRIAQDISISGFFWMNGATVSGSADGGVYDSGGAKLTSSGATTQAGANAIQTVALGTKYRLAGGRNYYLGLLSTRVEATFFMATALAVEEARHLGVTDETNAGTSLPATQTRTAPTNGNIPIFGIYSGNVP